MGFRMLLLDIDGTLRPMDSPVIPKENVHALEALQMSGIQIAVATGRCRSAVPEEMLNGVHPDYWICGAGAQVLDEQNCELAVSPMAAHSVAAIHAFCEERDFPLILNYPDGCFVHIGYAQYLSRTDAPPALKNAIYDPLDTRRFRETPISCFAWMPQEVEAEFHRCYPDEDLTFYFYRGKFCDVMQSHVTKAYGLERLLEHIGLEKADCVFIGDGENDIPLMQMAGLSYCMENGAPDAKAAAGRIAPSATACGVAAVCRELWPEAFQDSSG